MRPRFKNYLRAYRLGLGFSQRRMGFLIGSHNGAKVSRFERQERVPKLIDALACEVVTGVAVHTLFPEYYQRAKERVARRARRLYKKLKERRRTHKIRHQMERLKALVICDGISSTNKRQV